MVAGQGRRDDCLHEAVIDMTRPTWRDVVQRPSMNYWHQPLTNRPERDVGRDSNCRALLEAVQRVFVLDAGNPIVAHGLSTGGTR